MNQTLPKIQVARASKALALDDANAWQAFAAITPLALADGSGPARQQTRVRVCFDDRALYVRFDCDDRDIWGTYTQRDDRFMMKKRSKFLSRPAPPRRFSILNFRFRRMEFCLTRRFTIRRPRAPI
ncbi:MAG: hypothetical protein DCC52_16955 [Chloroflexi bacterium]|nr:MAG: hypothetical protein DCC52_16955 [Chloroflexota bacterium]